MRDIPRNELLDSIAQGWTVRRKDWAEGLVFCLHAYKPKGSTVIFLDWAELVHQDDWEGEPPEPRLRNDNQTLSVAVAYLKDGAAFIRRKNWDGFHGLSIKDILANDWEVWA